MVVAALHASPLGGVKPTQIAKGPEFLAGSRHVWGGESLRLAQLDVAPALRGEALTLRVEQADGRYSLRDDERALGEGQAGELSSFADGDVKVRIEAIEAPAGAEFVLRQRTRISAINSLREDFQVSQVGGAREGTGILELTMTGTSRQEIRRALDAVAEIFLMQNVQRESEEVQRSLEFLREQIPELRAELRASEDSLNEYLVESDTVALSSEAEALIERSIELERRLSELKFTEAELAQRFTRNHPQYERLERQRQQLEEERAELNQQISELPEEQRELVRRQRDADVLQAIYVNVLNKSQELEIARAGTVGNVRIIDSAALGDEPIAPKTLRNVLLALFLGAGLAGATVLGRDWLLRGVETPNQVEESGLPVYASIPLSPGQGKLVQRQRIRGGKSLTVPRGLLAWTDPADNSIEALRGLRTSLHFAMLEHGDKRLMICGPSPGVGKSFISANLAAVCAGAGQRVLLVDGDLRRGHMHRFFKGEREGGLAEYLAGDRSFDQTVRDAGHESLDYVSRGVTPPNPSELLTTERFRAFLDAASERYDLVLIDTPPALAVTDAAVIGAQCSITLLVARFQASSVKELHAARRRLESGGARVSGVVLNAMERRASTDYSYYGYHGYQSYSYESSER